MKGIVISTDRLIGSSEARKKFGKLLKEVSAEEKNYYVIMENGKVTALLVHPHWLQEKEGHDFPNLEELRREWSRYTEDVSDAMDKIVEMDEKDLPPLLQ
jgi:hypothetical protein